MSNKKEQSLVQNLVSVQSLISFSKQIGSRYKPALPALNTEKVQQVWEAARMAVDGVSTELTAHQRVVNERREIFKGLSSFTTRIISALEAAQAGEETIKDARYLQRKMSGKRAGNTEQPPPAKEGEQPAAPRTISASQAGFDNKVEHFARLVMLVIAEPAYKPNETELSANGLEEKLAALKQANAAVIDSKTRLDDARTRRHEVLFHPQTGLVPLAKAMKAYLKSVFGNNSSEYKQVKALRLRSKKY